jgi:hypothetical protein
MCADVKRTGIHLRNFRNAFKRDNNASISVNGQGRNSTHSQFSTQRTVADFQDLDDQMSLSALSVTSHTTNGPRMNKATQLRMAKGIENSHKIAEKTAADNKAFKLTNTDNSASTWEMIGPSSNGHHRTSLASSTRSRSSQAKEEDVKHGSSDDPPMQAKKKQGFQFNSLLKRSTKSFEAKRASTNSSPLTPDNVPGLETSKVHLPIATSIRPPMPHTLEPSLSLKLMRIPERHLDDTFGDSRAEEQRKRDKLKEVAKECSELTPFMYLGGVEVANNLEMLQSLGITHILNCAGNACENFFPKEFEYHTLYLEDGMAENVECVLYDAIDFIANSCHNSDTNKVLVHCHQGVSRSSSICIAYMMWKYHWGYDHAYQTVRERRSITRPNIAFMCQLIEWGKRIHQDYRRETPFLYIIQSQSESDPDFLVARQAKELQSSHLRSNTCVVLDSPTNLFIWVGRDASPAAQVAARKHEERLRVHEHAVCPTVVVMESYEPTSFWQYFLDKSSDVVDVYLGGPLGTSWRADSAIPMLERAAISYFDPQVPTIIFFNCIAFVAEHFVVFVW